MINKDRIVPVVKTDLLTLYGTILTLIGTSYAVIQGDIEGNFDVTGSGAAGNKLAATPLKSVDFKSGVTGGTVYCIIAEDFEGVKVAGSAATLASASLDYDEILKNGDLYSIALSSGEVTIAHVSPQQA